MAKRTYDIRVRNAIAHSGNADLFPELHIPRSTALQWIREGVKEVVTAKEYAHFSINSLAQIDVEFSNSMIEALFRSLKHRWLYVLSRPNFEAVCRAVDEYLNDHNNKIPHYPKR